MLTQTLCNPAEIIIPEVDFHNLKSMNNIKRKVVIYSAFFFFSPGILYYSCEPTLEVVGW